MNFCSNCGQPVEIKVPPDDAKEWEGREGKLALLER